MGSTVNRSSTLLWCCSFIAMATMVAHGDYSDDYKECASTLLDMTVCLPYASKQAPKPTSACCSKLKEVINKEPKCLCVLIRRYDAPAIQAYKLDLDRTLNLPNSCDIPANVSACPGLLGIDPNSPDGKIFSHKSNFSSNGSPGVTNGSEDTREMSGGGRRNYYTSGNWLAMSWTVEILQVFLISSFMAILGG